MTPKSPSDAMLFREAMENIRIETINESETLSEDIVTHWLTPRGDIPTEQTHANTVLSFRRDGVQHKLFQQLQKGQLTHRSQIDLHGLTTTQASEAILKHLSSVLQSQANTTLIIHGKGAHNTDTDISIMKSFVNNHLRKIPAVLAFCSATPQMGGTGAVFVLLKTIRSQHD